MKLAITVQSGTLTGKRLEVSEGFLTIGRGQSCNLVFNPTAENMVSTKHAYIEAKPDGFYLIDNKSTNGTFVNGNRIQVAKLNPGDVIQFGKNGPEANIFIDGQNAQSEPTVVLRPQPVQPVIPQQVQPLNPSSSAYNPPPVFNPPPVENFQQQMQATQMGNFGQQFQVAQGGFVSPPVSVRNSFSNIGLGRPLPPPRPLQTGLYIGAVLALILGGIFSLIVIALIVNDVGIIIAIFAAAIAFLPVLVYILPLMGLDRYDPEPPWLLFLAFAWGALVAVVISYFINTGVGLLAYFTTGSATIAGLASTVISAPIFEEGSKGIGVILILLCFRKYFDDILDGIVYAGVIALGFATVENVFYYGREYKAHGLDSLIFLFLIRGILSPFAHVTFTSMTGIGCGISRESHRVFVRFVLPVLGYICAIFLHSLWNGMAIAFTIFIMAFGLQGPCREIGLGSQETIGLCGWLVGYSILEVPLFLIFLTFAIYVMRRQNRILKEMLALDVARGTIPPEHLAIATSFFKSIGWVYGSIFSGKYLARSRYLRAVAKLGLSAWHIQRATAAHGQTASFQQNPLLRDEVLRLQSQI